MPTPYISTQTNEGKKMLTCPFSIQIDRLTAEQWRGSDVTCQPMPRLITEGGHGVALAYRETAMKAPVDCIAKQGV